MAKKKIIKDTMKSKVEIKEPPLKEEKISRLVGSIFIGLGILLVAFGIFSYIKYREEPLLDPELEAPSLEEVTSITNGEKIKIVGNAQEFDSVFIFVNDEKVGESKVGDDGEFTYEYTVEDEGTFNISIAGVKGFPNRYISVASSVKESVVDRTPPSAEDVSLKYGTETNKETFVLVGTTEPNASVEVKRGIDSYKGLVDAEGNFRIEDIVLEEGKNVFSVYITDLAGNQVQLDEKVRVEYSPHGDVDGDAVVNERIPQASGTLDALLSNRVMTFFGLVAIFAFLTSSIVVYKKQRV
ncbi:hypothetical protein GX888_03145 [Candidatus Dojkabacteria bacterium]|uniref:Bacterial Ig-like domain-containing protein n=1 Tax=Candidatus Dojkabacteria bacterium TaxID=2099670 RepID=A0A847VDX8_9BACT|nr:hypothetical protein [Candidatus Dojkabacteria bacterium]